MFGWRRRKIERLDFIVAGAQKSGTTALHYFLAKHPKISMGDQQEIHFFDDDATFATTVDYEQLHKHYPVIAHQVTFISSQRRNGFGDTTRKSNCSFFCAIPSSAPLRIGTCKDLKAASR